jgi:hypothetical protein
VTSRLGTEKSLNFFYSVTAKRVLRGLHEGGDDGAVPALTATVLLGLHAYKCISVGGDD